MTTLTAALRRNRVVLFLARLQTLWRFRSSAREKPRVSVRYLCSGHEVSTFTYELANQAELATFVAGALGVEPARIAGYFEELERDTELRTALAEGLRTHPNRRNAPRYTKRIAYYAIVRITTPAVVVETGTHDGLGTAVLARALQRNAAEGGPAGRVLTFDVNPDAGWLIPGFLEALVERFVGPSSQTLGPALRDRSVDFFIHDSLRTAANERFELETVISRAAGPELLVATDHAPDTYVLRDVCAQRGAWYGAFQEQPRDHFFRGVEMGLGVIAV